MSMRNSMSVYTWKTHTHTYIVDRNTPTSMGVVRKRKANKYLLTQQKWRMVVHWWKQKAEDEERRARKPAGCRPCALLVPALKTRGRREGRTEERRGEGREEGINGGKTGGTKKGLVVGGLFINNSCLAQKKKDFI